VFFISSLSSHPALHPRAVHLIVVTVLQSASSTSIPSITPTMPGNMKQHPNVPLRRFLTEPRAQGLTVFVIESAENPVLAKEKEMIAYLTGWEENWKQLKALGYASLRFFFQLWLI
jgi:hypothetical protein